MVVAVAVAPAALVVVAVVVAAVALVVVAVVVAAVALVVVALLALVEQRPVEAGGGTGRLVVVEQGDRLGAHARTADLAEHVKEGEGGLRAGERDLEVLGRRDGEADVLAQVLDEEARLEVARDRPGRKGARGARPARAVGEDLEHAVHVDAGLLGEGDGVGVAHHARREAHLVAELRRLAAARLVEVEAPGRERLEQGEQRLHVLLGSTDDEGERAVDGTLLAARDGAVEGVLVLDLGRVVDVAGELRGARGEVDEPGAALGAADEAVRGQVDVLDVGGVAHHGEDDVGVCGCLGGRVGPVGPAGEKVLGLLPRAVAHRDVVASVEDVARDAGAHDAGADEGDLADVRVTHVLRFLSTDRVTKGTVPFVTPAVRQSDATCPRARAARCGP